MLGMKSFRANIRVAMLCLLVVKAGVIWVLLNFLIRRDSPYSWTRLKEQV